MPCHWYKYLLQASSSEGVVSFKLVRLLLFKKKGVVTNTTDKCAAVTMWTPVSCLLHCRNKALTMQKLKSDEWYIFIKLPIIPHVSSICGMYLKTYIYSSLHTCFKPFSSCLSFSWACSLLLSLCGLLLCCVDLLVWSVLCSRCWQMNICVTMCKHPLPPL